MRVDEILDRVVGRLASAVVDPAVRREVGRLIGGDELTQAGSRATVQVEGGPAASPVFLVVSASLAPCAAPAHASGMSFIELSANRVDFVERRALFEFVPAPAVAAVTPSVVSTFGGQGGHNARQFFHLHSLASQTDSQGNLYVGEVNDGMRYYRLRSTGLGAPQNPGYSEITAPN